MAHPKHGDVRRRYDGRCGYCDVSEAETGGELTVDHFQPISACGDETDDNLVYCCFRCNAYKGDFWPGAADLQKGQRVVHPFLESSAIHFRLNERTGLVEALTSTGRFHIELLRLNRPQLVERRLAQRLHDLLAQNYRLLQSENEMLSNRVALLETYLRELAQRS